MPSEGDTMSASDLPELLPCPFCGCEAVSVWRGHRIICPRCDAEGPSRYELDGAKNIAAWNTRAGDKRAREVVEALLSPDMLEVGRKAIEDALIEHRDARLSVLARNNGLVVKERDGTPSDTIRMGPETALAIGIRAMLASAPTPGEKT